MEIEKAVDNFVNSSFYRNKETIGSICKTIRRLLKERKADRRSKCLLSFVELLAYCDKHLVLDDHSFNPGLTLTWGKDNLQRKFYGIDLSALYRENDKQIDKMLFVENEVPVFDFEYSYAGR